MGSSFSYAGIGVSNSVSMSIEAGITFSTSRRVRAVEGIQARHIPYMQSDTWKGVTYIQTYNKESGKYGYLLPSYYDQWFGSYPYKFSLDNQNIGFKAIREIIKTCDSYDPNKDPLVSNEEVLKYELINGQNL